MPVFGAGQRDDLEAISVVTAATRTPDGHQREEGSQKNGRVDHQRAFPHGFHLGLRIQISRLSVVQPVPA